jgi:hypothetical protein
MAKCATTKGGRVRKQYWIGPPELEAIKFIRNRHKYSEDVDAVRKAIREYGRLCAAAVGKTFDPDAIAEECGYGEDGPAGHAPGDGDVHRQPEPV